MAELTDLPKPEEVGIELVYDRTEEDVARLLALYRKGWANLSAEEKQEWTSASNKGAYNTADINRVIDAVDFLAYLLCERGYWYVPNFGERTYWGRANIFYREDLQKYLAAVEGLRKAFVVAEDTPEIPTKISTVDEANAVEKIIADVYRLLLNADKALPRCGVPMSGFYPLTS